jgi:uncharacterized membrane protein YeiH
MRAKLASVVNHDNSDHLLKAERRHILTDLVNLRGGDVTAAPAAQETLRWGKDYVHSFLQAIDVFGTGVFAFSGALKAGKKGMDILGMTIIACITAMGGGTVRDVLMGNTINGGVFWMKTPLYIEICVGVAVSTFLIWPRLEKDFGFHDSAITICTADALGLAAFVVLGTQQAVKKGLAPTLWVASGVVTAVFGGIIRDVICGEPPRVMYPYRSMYGAGPALGSILYTVLSQKTRLETDFIAAISFLLTFIVRISSFNRKTRLPHWNDNATDN